MTTQHTATPDTLANILKIANSHDEIVLRGGDYWGEFELRTAHLSLYPYTQELATFRGPKQYIPNTKPTWMHIYPTAVGAVLRGLEFSRDGDIASLWRDGWNDYGIVVQASDTLIEQCDLRGMAKAVHVKDATSLRCTLAHNLFGPTIDSNLVVGSSNGVNRALLVDSNVFNGSYREDGIQTLPKSNLSDADKAKDLSNVGLIARRNTFRDQNENGIDLKGADCVVLEDNEFEHIAGSNNGAPNWNYNSLATITTGANSASGWMIARNNHIHHCCAGVRLLFPGWMIYHNDIEDNNWRPENDAHQGYGIRQPGQSARPAVVNNLVRGNLAGDLVLTNAEQRGNSAQRGLGVPLTFTGEAGKGCVVFLSDVRYFTNYFGREDVPAEQIVIGDRHVTVLAVDRRNRTVTIDRDLTWQAGQPVFWRAAAPTVGRLVDAPVEPPIIEPPAPPSPALTEDRVREIAREEIRAAVGRILA